MHRGLGPDFDAAELHGLGLIVGVGRAGSHGFGRCLGSIRLPLVPLLLARPAAQPGNLVFYLNK